MLEVYRVGSAALQDVSSSRGPQRGGDADAFEFQFGEVVVNRMAVSLARGESTAVWFDFFVRLR